MKKISTFVVALAGGVVLLSGCTDAADSDHEQNPTVLPSTSVSTKVSVSASPSVSVSSSASASPSATAVDLGVVQCKKLRAAVVKGDNPLAGLSKKQYDAIKADFTASQYIDLRTAGEHLVDSYLLASRDDTKTLNATELMDRASGLGRACAAHKG